MNDEPGEEGRERRKRERGAPDPPFLPLHPPLLSTQTAAGRDKSPARPLILPDWWKICSVVSVILSAGALKRVSPDGMCRNVCRLMDGCRRMSLVGKMASMSFRDDPLATPAPPSAPSARELKVPRGYFTAPRTRTGTASRSIWRQASRTGGSPGAKQQ